MIRIIDYGSGNLRSVQKAFERHGVTAEITSDPNCVAEADRLVLPGVGAFSDAMAALRERGLVDPIRSHIVADRPFLGICMGLQLLFETGWEGGRHDGLGVFAGDVAATDVTPIPELVGVTFDQESIPAFIATSGTPDDLTFTLAYCEIIQ